MNWFLLTVCVLQVGATLQYWVEGKFAMGSLMLLYGISNMILLYMGKS